MSLPIDIRDRVESLMNALPFNRWLGVHVVGLDLGVAQLRVDYRRELIGDPNCYALHGGVISALLDTCAGAAVWTTVGLDDGVSTVDILVDFIRPGRPCDLVAEARVVKPSRQLTVVTARAFHPDAPDESVAEARGVYSIRRYRSATDHQRHLKAVGSTGERRGDPAHRQALVVGRGDGSRVGYGSR